MEARYFLSNGDQEAQLTGAQKSFILKIIDAFGDFGKKISNAHNVKIADADIENVSIAAGKFQRNAIDEKQRSIFCRDGITDNISLFHYISHDYYVNIENRDNEVFDIRIVKRTKKVGMSRYWDVVEKVHISRGDMQKQNKSLSIIENGEKIFNIRIDNDESWYDDFLDEVCNL